MCFRAWIAFLQSERLDIPAMSAASCSEVVQFWAQNEAPEDIRANIKAWSACFGSRHKVFDALTAEAFLKAEFGASHAEVFRSAGHPVIQADLFRLGYLASRGGVYVDADTRPRVGSVQIIDAMTDLDVLTYETSRPKLHIQNAFISAVKGSDFALRCYLEGVCRVRDGSRPVQALAGGYMMTDVLTFNDEPPTQLAISGWFLRNRLIADRSRSYQGGDLDWRVWDANRLK